jgi:hypothetical protein
VSRSKRRTSRQAEQAERWLGPEAPARSRPWAYEELLFEGNGNGAEELDALAADLALELSELKRMQNDLYDQAVRVAELEGRVKALRHVGPEQAPEPAATAPEPDEPDEPAELRSLPSDPTLPRPVRRIPSLARVEGFQVDSPEGLVGYVEGLRFVSRIDEPDLLEVRGGRFGRELVLIPAEAVEEVDTDLERVVVRSILADAQDEEPHELVKVLRRALHQE